MAKTNRILKNFSVLAILSLLCPALAAQEPPAQEPPVVELPLLQAEDLENLPADLHPAIQRAFNELRNGKEDAEQAGEMARLFHAHGELDIAIPLYRLASSLEPEEFEWIYLLSVAQASDNRIEESIRTLENALRINPEYMPAHLRLGELLHQQGQTTKSLDHFLKVVGSEPDSPAAQFEVGKAYLDLAEYAKAIEHLEAACRLFNGFGPAHYALVQAYRSTGNMEEAKKHLAIYQENRFRKPLIEDPLLEPVYRYKTGKIRARDHINRGIELGRIDRVPEAIIEFRQALELEPENASVYIDLMILYGRAKQYEEAQALYEKAPASVLESAELHYNYGVIQVEAEQYERAAAAFREVIRINPNDPRAYNNLGQMLEKSAKFQEAMEQYSAALKVDPQFRRARFNLGRILIGMKRYAEAIDELQKILLPEGESTALYTFLLSVAYVRSGDTEKGIEYSEKALQLAEKHGLDDLVRSIRANLQRLRQAVGKTATGNGLRR